MSKVTVQTVHAIELAVKAGQRATKDTPAVPPVVKMIPPGTLLKINDNDELKELREAGSVIEPNGNHKLDLTSGIDADTKVAVPKVVQSGASDPRNPGSGSNPAPDFGDGEGDSGQEAASEPNKTGSKGRTPPANAS